jgi:hypothetical protein
MTNFGEDDPFESIVSINSKAYADGFDEGTMSGKRAAIVSGFKIGKQTALNIGGEVGQYQGVCEMFLIQHQRQSDDTASPLKSEKHVKLASQLLELIQNFDLIDCHNDSFAPTLTQIRDKFKQFCSITNSKNYVVEQDISRAKLNF